ncbi:plastocyanin/azurin family copper-binding protein [Nocardioides sp. CN2-186]|uniref:plastocyanin/azurin family copper-binding protein n=1 Tax=Nocardioides tweenelious TaxID=3156607 RepID=UPI0032B442F5
MISRIALSIMGATVLATGLAVTPVATSTAIGPTVSVVNMRFTPATLSTPLGSTVTWQFGDPMTHNSTSTQGFWSSGPKGDGDSYAHTFASSGAYPYRCTIHPSMTGVVNVPVGRSGSSASGWTLRWATGVVSGRSYDVQVRKGTGAWKALRNGTTAASAPFRKKGTWSVRARTMEGAATSGWSPAVKVTTG